ncbi:uncharacterized protein LOC114944006 [Nylanderia fulva]|uniref:uncharacterized protein LOC114944006 n=1 Tax=Nylanderia fulva TaxID=613905 RepID=UPI0010FBB668|nr:uncharacterized protein LOC114944006 [Nylanderia fulva]
MSELRNLLIAQTENIDSLKRVLVNFKKLAKVNVTLAKTQGRLATLEMIWASCREHQVRLLQTATSDEQKTLPYFQNGEFIVAEDYYNDTADLLRETISRFTTNQPSSFDRSTDSSVRESYHNNFQLPRISLPKFSGNFSEWESFKNTFESLVANNDSLTNTQKFHYLKTSVIGDAALIISNLKISDANYESAWQLIIDEYDDKLTLIHTHIHAFMCLPTMKSENVAELRTLRDTVSASLAALTNLNRPVSEWDDILIYIISQKFSARTKSEWNLKVLSSRDLPAYKDIHEFLTLRIRGLSDFSDYSKTISSKNDKQRSSVHNVTVVKCICCSGNHAITRCEEFRGKDVPQRSIIARQNKVCFNCLRAGHFTRQCPSKIRCAHCKRSHNTLLHQENVQTSNVGENSDSSKSKANATPCANKISVVGEAAVASVQSIRPPNNATPAVLLATAWVNVHTSEGRCFKVRALLDQGSNFSFISETLCQTIRTRRQRTDLQIKGFGEKYTGSARSRVSLKLTPCDKSNPVFPVTAYVFHRITSYAATRIQPVNSWPHLQGLSLADPSSRHQIHMLIGADVYGSLLMRDLRKGPPGTPTAQLTAFGWVISGPTGSKESALCEAAFLNCVLAEQVDSLLQRF